MSKVMGQSRLYRSAQEKAEFVAAWTKSGLSAQAFERKHGLARSSLWRWTSGAKGESQADVSARRAAVSFAPVHVLGAEPGAPSSERLVAEVLLGDDVRVRVLEGADLAQVTSLVRALRGGPAC